MKLGTGTIEERTNNSGLLCRVCGERMVSGDVAGGFTGSMGADFNFHRVCMKRWLEYSYDVFPVQYVEIMADPGAQNAMRVERGRWAREFEEYRAGLIERYGKNA